MSPPLLHFARRRVGRTFFLLLLFGVFLYRTQVYKPWLRKGYDIRPTIAVTEAHIDLPEVREAVRVGRLKPDGKILTEDGQSFITKVGEKH